MEMTKENREKIIDVLYERCANGEISRNQRELLINKVNSMFTVTESENTAVTEVEEISPREKYNMFSETVYEKCTKGEITIEEREQLLEKAREQFFHID